MSRLSLGRLRLLVVVGNTTLDLLPLDIHSMLIEDNFDGAKMLFIILTANFCSQDPVQIFRQPLTKIT